MLEVNLSPKRSPEDHCSSEQRGRDGGYKVTAFCKDVSFWSHYAVKKDWKKQAALVFCAASLQAVCHFWSLMWLFLI